ncbi:unnamed protein product [Lactuca virosa]|uniref:Myb-like domain-containing protein n=1 Tax=Lactuca virosa TaxID=75947 RepID=A0AAU9LUT7_9ASTR|nr:unnamed protein product [Lactuca virosa]
MNTIWTPVENKLFENAIAKFAKDTPDWWQRVAEMVLGKKAADVMWRYKELEDDVSSIEAGFYPKYGYNNSTSPFTLEWGNNNGVDSFLSPPAYGARGKRSSAAVVAVVAAGRPLEQERKKGVPWREEEHNGKDKRRASIHDITTINLNENHITSPMYKTTASPEQCKVPWNQPNNENTTMAFNQTHGAIFMSPRYGGNSFGAFGGGGGGGG